MRIIYARLAIAMQDMIAKVKIGALRMPAFTWKENFGLNPAFWQTLFPYKRMFTGEYMITARKKKYARQNIRAKKTSKLGKRSWFMGCFLPRFD